MNDCNWQNIKYSLVYETLLSGKTIKVKVDTDQKFELSGTQTITKGGDLVFSMGYNHQN